MTEFFHSHAFWFLIGCFVGGAIGFIGAAILAASGQASRMEEKIEERMEAAPNLTCKSCEYWEGRCEFNGACPYNPLNNEPSIRLTTQNNPRTD